VFASLIAKTDAGYLVFVRHQSEILIGIAMPLMKRWPMMKRGDHPDRVARHRSIRPSFEKTIHNLCPSCGSTEFTVYFESGSPRKVGALCYSCGTVGFFARDNFFELGRISKGPRLTGGHRMAKIAGH
jgi:hypothetical protein